MSCVICLKDAHDPGARLLPAHGCKTCKQTWKICAYCHDRLRDGLCPICRADYAPSPKGYEHLEGHERDLKLTVRVSPTDVALVSQKFAHLAVLDISKRCAEFGMGQLLGLDVPPDLLEAFVQQ